METISELRARAKNQLEGLESRSEARVLAPMGLRLFLLDETESMGLPAVVARNPEMLAKSEERRRLFLSLQNIFARITDSRTSLDEAMVSGKCTEDEVINLYEQLIAFWQSDDNHGRLLLYLPFQLLPDMSIQHGSERLNRVRVEFGAVYRKVWQGLLAESNARAAFVDGDILEHGLGEPPRVRKAAHLIPELLRRNLVKREEIVRLFNETVETELKNSIFDGLRAADEKVDAAEEGKQDKSVSEIMTGFERGIAGIETLFAAGSEYIKKYSLARVNWEKQVKVDELINTTALALAKKIADGETSIDDWRAAGIFGILEVRGVDFAVKLLLEQRPQEAILMAASYTRILERIWKEGTVGERDEVIRVVSHWSKLGLLEPCLPERWGMKLPNFASPLPVNAEEVVGEQYDFLNSAIEKIANHPVLSRYLFPLFLVYGSRMRGYATLNSDHDIAIFIKPGTPWEKHDEILRLLLEEVPDLKKANKMPEFWMEKDDGFAFREGDGSIATVAGATQVHFLFEGVWVGRGDEVSEIYEDVLKKYLDLNRFGDQKEMARMQLLRWIENNSLQFRLMHKGYRRFYPPMKEKGIQRSKLIDGNSDFWDPGYRRVASLLFVGKVFLPDLCLG